MLKFLTFFLRHNFPREYKVAFLFRISCLNLYVRFLLFYLFFFHRMFVLVLVVLFFEVVDVCIARINGEIVWKVVWIKYYFVAEHELLKILVRRLPQNTSDVNVEYAGKSKELHSLYDQLLVALISL